MLDRAIIQEQLKYALEGVDAPFLGEKYAGKVRDCYVRDDKRILITSDRLSAFDRVLTTIPFKGHLLTKMANFWFEKTSTIVANHIIDYPHPNVLVSREIQMLPVEVIIRGYLTGSAWRDYEAGNAVSGIALPSGMKRSQRFDTPLITPSTKAEKGDHDEPISSEEIVAKGLVEKALWEEVCTTAMKLFEFGSAHAESQGLILVDTKYEFGCLPKDGGGVELILADEIHTQDSSRYWMLNSYQDRFANGEDPEMLDKEFVRRWLIGEGYMGDGTPPEFTDEFRVDIATKYIEAYEMITGEEFVAEPGNKQAEIEEMLKELV